MRLYSAIAGFLGAMNAMVLLVKYKVDLLHSASTIQALGDLVLCACVAILVFASINIIVLAACALSVRGPQAVRWRRIRDCRNFAAWICLQWDFFSIGGRHEGVRFCGLEVAVKGFLTD
jgi:hypothetical protein